MAWSLYSSTSDHWVISGVRLSENNPLLVRMNLHYMHNVTVSVALSVEFGVFGYLSTPQDLNKVPNLE